MFACRENQAANDLFFSRPGSHLPQLPGTDESFGIYIIAFYKKPTWRGLIGSGAELSRLSHQGLPAFSLHCRQEILIIAGVLRDALKILPRFA
jgi:hypothetical protein